VRLCLARAVIASARADHDAERHFLDEALRLASVWGDPVLLGTVHAGLGRLHEARDADKAFIHQRESGAFFETALRQQGLGDLLEAIDPGAVQTSRVPIADGQGSAFVSACGLAVALLRQAWLLVSRNDPRCRPLLMRSQQLLACIPNAPLDTLALAAQAHGELLRREGDVRGGLESTLAALALCERSGNRLQQLRIEGTLALIYGDQGDLDKAQAYAQRVFGHAASGRVDPEILSSTHQNLGNAQFWAGRLDDAVRSYEEGLRFATASGLRTLIGRAHYNLAEACYTRFQAGGDAQDEARGDMHARLSGAVWSLAGDKAALEATSNLKRTVLGEREQLIYDRMLPGELAAHFDEMSEIQTERLHQSAARDAADRIRATLKIARAYGAIAAKEREAALALIRLQPKPGQWASELAEVRSAFEAALSDEEREVQRWRSAPGCPVPAALLPLVVRQSQSPEGLTKSNYAHRCGLSPATASKHLAQLAALGLVTRHGLGPTTRYLAQKD
jgi:tetratricopeptide (TPR) repeat protein